MSCPACGSKEKSCIVEGCTAKHHAKGLCKTHYYRQKNNGSPLIRTCKDPNDYITIGCVTKIGCYDKDSNLTGHILIDTEDADACKVHKWYFDGRYIVTGINTGEWKGIRARIHNVVLNHKPNRIASVDHINRDVWDNRKINLRICTASDNNCNKPRKSNNQSGYKGVYKDGSKWYAQITKDSKTVTLGWYNTPELAAMAYNKAAKELHGEFAKHNKIPLLRRK